MTPTKSFSIIGVIIVAVLIILIAYRDRDGFNVEDWAEANNRFKSTVFYTLLGAAVSILAIATL